MISWLTLALAAATTPVPLAPSGKWIVDYQKDMCLVSRAFGPTDASTMLVLKPGVSMEDGGQTLYVLTPSSGGGVRRGRAVVVAQPSGQQWQIDYVSWLPKGTTLRGYEVHADQDVVAVLAQSTGVTITPGKDGFSFVTGKMQPVLNALTACNDDLFKSWGIDPAAKAVPRRGMSPGTWFSADSYPSDAKRRGAQGRSVIAVTVSADGMPSACRVVVKADPALDETSCNLAMRKGRFEKSLEKTDRYAILSVRWELWDE
ncbi:energy transducer TonB [Sphingomonas bacterium]|uniref:energy transducer TonB n=1 Tax=Sphingomonas bacterium TaxID=1895847 RepID=UPI0026038353|nr:energy transducer TonB [Sphingomonas bacterium]MDB5679992.1 hypothetical protein [Sphingomonas bacterium]